MKSILTILLTLCASSAMAADEPDNGIPIEKIIASVSHQTNRRFVIDPRVQARLHLVGEDPLRKAARWRCAPAADTLGGYDQRRPRAAAHFQRRYPTP